MRHPPCCSLTISHEHRDILLLPIYYSCSFRKGKVRITHTHTLGHTYIEYRRWMVCVTRRVYTYIYLYILPVESTNTTKSYIWKQTRSLWRKGERERGSYHHHHHPVFPSSPLDYSDEAIDSFIHDSKIYYCVTEGPKRVNIGEKVQTKLKLY